MAKEQVDVGKYRAIMTTADRNRISGEADVEEEKRYQAITRVRSRIEELEKDVKILEESHPELLDELREVVCEE